MNRHAQITLVLNQSEMAALRTVANADLRRPRDQARFILRQALGLTDDGETPDRTEQRPGVLQETPVVAQ